MDFDFDVVGLFSGIGLLEVAAGKLGGRHICMAEQDEFCQRVLRKRFPGVPIFDDVRVITAGSVAALRGDAQKPLVVVGGF